MKALLTVLFICTTLSGQSQKEVHQKYGTPITETFAVGSGIFVTISYAETGDVCEMIIHPQQLTSSLDYPITKTMQTKALIEIIDKLVPTSQRGKWVIATFLNVECLPLNNCSGVEDDYKRVTIIRIGGTDQERYARIRWKARSCRE
jgi:hypothetical protein